MNDRVRYVSTTCSQNVRLRRSFAMAPELLRTYGVAQDVHIRMDTLAKSSVATHMSSSVVHTLRARPEHVSIDLHGHVTTNTTWAVNYVYCEIRINDRAVTYLLCAVFGEETRIVTGIWIATITGHGSVPTILLNTNLVSSALLRRVLVVATDWSAGHRIVKVLRNTVDTWYDRNPDTLTIHILAQLCA